MRFFAGRENKLPADMHFVYALIAPRPVLMSTAINDAVESTWAVEQMYESIAPVWRLLGKSGNLALRYRPGQHSPDAATYAAHSQFLSLCSENKAPADVFRYRPYHPWDYAAWAKLNPPPVPPTQPPTGPRQTRQLLGWLLGDGPAYAPAKVTLGDGESEEIARTLNRGGLPRFKCRSDDVNADFYYPSNQAPIMAAQAPPDMRKLPTVILLAPLHCSRGYAPGYRRGDIPHVIFTKAGFLVLAFDPIATGARQEERRDFYDRHPRWSILGKMVLDARHAIDAVLANPNTDPQRVCLVGFGMGGFVAACTAALDERVAAAVSVSGFAPFRTDTDAVGDGGLRRWSHLYGWLPRLGQFVGRESEAPVDFPEILSAIAPRRMLVVAPKLDWRHPCENVAQTVEAAKRAYRAHNAVDNLQFDTPNCLAEFNNDIQARVIRFMSFP